MRKGAPGLPSLLGIPSPSTHPVPKPAPGKRPAKTNPRVVEPNPVVRPKVVVHAPVVRPKVVDPRVVGAAVEAPVVHSTVHSTVATVEPPMAAPVWGHRRRARVERGRSVVVPLEGEDRSVVGSPIERPF